MGYQQSGIGETKRWYAEYDASMREERRVDIEMTVIRELLRELLNRVDRHRGATDG